MEPNTDAILTVLEDLGSTGVKVAQKLKKLGFKGVPGCPWRCPVARYLQSFFPDADITVGTPEILTKDLAVKTPKPVQDFIKSFDGIARGGK